MISFEAVLTGVVETPMQNEEWTNNVLVNVKVIYLSLYPGGFAVKGWVWGRSLAGIGFEPHRGHGYLSVVSVMCWTGNGLCFGLITRPEESTRVCMGVTECDQVQQSPSAATMRRKK